MDEIEIDKLYAIMPEVELTIKNKLKPSQRPTICSSNHAYELLKYNWDAGKMELVEQFKVLLLDRANRCLGIFHASTGGITGTVADPRHILVTALKANAVSIILSHNHPSGALKPSKADEEMTAKIKAAAAFLDIKVLDHVIMTNEGYFSFADEGIVI